ncbi:hypothetical protein P0136_11600 [Lentisphaerota bacterium ZTH]|nr:hypothetical protein JYG24_10880 [Lentisphaerota bacterium]WET06002.1 hypothetical protein P0136_11600 [Lentisphaerota bacterium ZTH]
MKTSNLFILIVLSAAILGCTLLSGCMTEAEKRGYSSIPQNYPATWEQKSIPGN